jgi:ATP-binding cassette subfamily B protein/subfamily B ATP-binding cassette protein MsbA
MAFLDRSSKQRYAAYHQRRRTDRAWVTREVDERGRQKKDKTQRTRGFFELLRELFALSRPHRPAIILSLVTVTITSVMGLAIPASTKIATDYIVTDNPGPSGLPEGVRAWLGLAADTHDTAQRVGLLWTLGFAMVALALVGVAINMLGRWHMTRVTKRLQVDLRRQAFEQAMRLPMHRIHHYKSGGVSSILREDGGLAGDLLFNIVYNPWRALVQLLGTMVVLAWSDWRLLAGGLAIIPLIWFTHRTWIARIRPLYRDQKVARTALDASTTEAFGGIRVVRGFGRSRAESARFVSGQHFLARLEMLTWWWSRFVDIAWAVLIPAASAAVLVYGGRAVLTGSLTIGDLMMFSAYLLMLLGPLEMLSSTAANIQTNLAALDRILNLLGEEPEFAGLPPGKPIDPAAVRGEIGLRHVWFSYPSLQSDARRVGEQPATHADSDNAFVLRDVSLDVPAGTTLALVGVSGSGKTTLCNLVARFYDPTRGSITLDGEDLKAIDPASYRTLLGIVEQDVFLFDGTVGENIAYARRDATPEMVKAAATAAHAHDFIIEMDKGYDTVIGERGVRLSGGQKQRVAIARAILADPAILILDEATSNLDSESEALIQRSLATLMRGRTCLVIAHRLSTIRNADAIAVLEGGQIIETGTHESLIARGGKYAFLVKLQTEGHQPASATAGL